MRICTMRTLSRGVLFCSIAIVTAAWNNEQKLKTKRQEVFTSPFKLNNGINGVASFADVTSRNGKVSTLSGVKLFPTMNRPINVGNSNARQFFYPITVSKESDGKFASNSIQIYPESVVVSARSGYGPNIKPWPGKINVPFEEDIFNHPDLEPFNVPRHLDAWFPKDIFKPVVPPTIDHFRNNWLYPTFNPFVNIWR
ncbi:uncharacterized protein LOC131851866 [Achroia grisella]|uniref:uncharacterized protein LOC131851866 n=1 Tax=Achroia grisella TaxID=688607 RepID=UPI0027D33C53|nr:uncharacterized protein LOC131851866 [Achroia grisella]